ncbi:hypothetical protein WMY93_007313 [Mugilogobius chulae]|uniref:Uncharacterized protein n=1 Tax=Mugilogobius chulae TaxID=88201 RepID=A0AAW0PLP5_9GOBI
MSNYPLSKDLGITFVLRPFYAPEQKLNTALLTTGIVLEMFDFTEFLAGQYISLLKELLTHNFGEVYEPCYLNRQIRDLVEKKTQQPPSDRAAFCEQPFAFLVKKSRPQKADSEGDEMPKKKKLALTRLGYDFLWEEKTFEEDSSYMCPVDFDANVSTDEEGASVDVETVLPKEERESPTSYYSFHKQRLRKTNLSLPISEIFSEDTLPMSQKSVNQREWALRTNRIAEIQSRETESNQMFARSREIGLDYNVASGRAKNLDLQLLTNHTLYEVYKFCMHLSRSVINFLLNLVEMNFNLMFHENFASYLYGKEKSMANQELSEEFLNSQVQFLTIYNMSAESENQNMTDDDDFLSEEYFSDEFPYCKKIGVNLWSLKGRPPGKKLHLNAMTHGALLEIWSLARRLCSKPRDLMHDVLEHNFDVDLKDPTSDESRGFGRWLEINKFIIKKSFCMIKTYMWLIECVDLKQYNVKTNAEMTEMPVPKQEPKEFTYEICKEIGLDLNLSCKSATKQKLDPKLLTRGALFEVHNYVETKCNRYVPALYEILDYNFDLSSQRHRRVEFAWSVAAQVLAMVRKGGRTGEYMRCVFQLPFEPEEGEICKREEEEGEVTKASQESADDEEVTFVKRFIPVDIDVEIE